MRRPDIRKHRHCIRHLAGLVALLALWKPLGLEDTRHMDGSIPLAPSYGDGEHLASSKIEHFGVKTRAFQAEHGWTKYTRPSTTRVCQNSSRTKHTQWFINGSSPSRPDPKSADPSPLEKKEEFREAGLSAPKSVLSRWFLMIIPSGQLGIQMVGTCWNIFKPLLSSLLWFAGQSKCSAVLLSMCWSAAVNVLPVNLCS